MLKYDIEITDSKGKLYKTCKGKSATKFTFTDDSENEDVINLICQYTYDDYKAVCKKGSQINIEVKSFNTISNTFMVLYSFYGDENKFVKH